MCARSRLVPAIAATILIAAAFANGVRLTHALDWPVGPDTFRDIAASEAVTQSIGRTLRRGVPLADPYYRGEVFWYNPLLPSILAAISKATSTTLHVVAARAPVYLNLATPIAFFWLAATLFDSWTAVAALAVFLFVEPFPAWQAATYSPWLIVSNFAQAFFYLALVAWTRFRARPRAGLALLVGVLAGTAILAHTAPAAVLAVILAVDTLSLLWRKWRDRGAVGQWVWLSALVVFVTLIVAVPVLATPLHYHGRILEPYPFLYLDPSMAPENLGTFLATNATAYAFVLPALVGFAALIASAPSAGRRLLLLWFGAALGLFVWSAYAWRWFDLELMTRLTISPAHHFLFYLRGAQSMLCGVGVLVVVRRAALRIHRPSLEPSLTLATVALLIGISLPGLVHRDDSLMAGSFSPNQQATVDWIASHTDPDDVFLAPENASVSMVGITGRKTVIVSRVLSNPYVDWYRRDTERQAMWDALAAGDCRAFTSHADPFFVTHVMTIEGMTPLLEPGTCGFARTVDAPPFAIYTRK